MKILIVLLVVLCCPPCKMDDESDLEALLTELVTIEKRLRTNEKYVTELQKENKAQAGEIADLKLRSNSLDIKVEDMKKNKKDTKVAFSASLLGSKGIGNIGPFENSFTLKYQQVFTNIGEAYNPKTGIFTAPVRGVYKFEMYAYAYASDNHPVTTFLTKNGQEIVIAHGHQTGPHTVSSSNGVSLLLSTGDEVYVKLWKGRIIYDNSHCASTFSGHLLFAL